MVNLQNGFWIATNLNPAVLVTRKTEVHEPLLQLWTVGPEFLKIPFDQWPLGVDCDVEPQNLPDIIKITLIKCIILEYNGFNICNFLC